MAMYSPSLSGRDSTAWVEHVTGVLTVPARPRTADLRATAGGCGTTIRYRGPTNARLRIYPKHRLHEVEGVWSDLHRIGIRTCYLRELLNSLGQCHRSYQNRESAWHVDGIAAVSQLSPLITAREPAWIVVNRLLCAETAVRQLPIGHKHTDFEVEIQR